MGMSCPRLVLDTTAASMHTDLASPRGGTDGHGAVLLQTYCHGSGKYSSCQKTPLYTTSKRQLNGAKIEC